MGSTKNMVKDDSCLRTPQPSVGKQLWVLIKKQLEVERKNFAVALLRVFIPPLFLIAYSASYSGGFENLSKQDAGVISTFSPRPMAIYEPGYLLSQSPLNSTGRLWVDGDASVNLTDLAFWFVNLSYVSAEDLHFPNFGDEATFKAACDSSDEQDFAGGVFFTQGSPAWDFNMYVEGDKISMSFSDIDANDFNLNLESGVYGVQKMVIDSIVHVEGISSSPFLPFIQQTPSKYNGFDTPWFLLWLPGFYILVGRMFSYGFYLTPLVADRRKELVKAFVMIGVPQWIYWMHYAVVFSMGEVVQALLSAVLFVEMKFAPKAQLLLVFFGFLFSGIQFTLQAALIPKFVQNDSIAGLLPFLIWILSSVSAIGIINAPLIVQCLCTIVNPWWATFQFAAILVKYDYYGLNIGLGFADVVDSGYLAYLGAQIGGILFYVFIVYWLNRPKRVSSTFKQSATNAAIGLQSSATMMSDGQMKNHEAIPDDKEVLLTVADVKKDYKTGGGCFGGGETVHALNGVNLQVLRGEVLGYLGHNGSGKSTTCNQICELEYPDSGIIEYRFHDGRTVRVGSGSGDLIRSRIGVCPQHDMLFEELSMRDNLVLFAKLKGGIEIQQGQSEHDAILAEVQRRIEEVKFTSKDTHDEDQPVKTYSGGMKRKVSIAISLIGDPELVLMDEPTAGMDPYNRRTVWDMIHEAKKGRSILLTTHFMDEADILSDRIAILRKGKLVASGTSLFLKHRFGAGYSLKYSCKGRDLVKTADSTIQKAIGTAKFVFETVDKKDNELHRVHWTLPHGSEDSFANLLNKLNEIGCEDVNVELTTLEQVFLKTGAEDMDMDENEAGEQEEVEALENKAAGDEHHIPIDTLSQYVRETWVDPEEDQQEQRKLNVSFSSRVWNVATVFWKNNRREPESIFFGTFMPLLYVLGAFLAQFFIEENLLQTPDPIILNSDVVIREGETAPQTTVFGAPSGINPYPWDENIFLETGVPSTIGLFFDKYYLGGAQVSNVTLFFNSSLTFSLPILQSIIGNLALYQQNGNTKSVSINSTLVPLPYIRQDDFQVVPFLFPMLIGIGYMTLAFTPIDLAMLSEYKLFSVFRIMGIDRFTVYCGVLFSNFLATFVPFFVLILGLALGFQSPVVGSGGRLFTVILIMIAYGYSVIPVSLFFQFEKVSTAKNVFPTVWLIGTIVPFIVYTVVYSNNKETGQLMGDILSVIPPMAFQRALQELILLSNEYDDPSVSLSSIWEETRVYYCILLMFGVGTVAWVVLVIREKARAAHKVGDFADTAEPVESDDPDIGAEAELSKVDCDGINARSLVKYFRIVPDTSEYKFRYANIGYWCERLFTCCKDPFRAKYGVKKALKGISFGVKSNDLYVLLGPNGAGKSTCISAIVQDLAPDCGEIALAGEIATPATFKKGNVSYCPQSDSLFPNLTVREHMVFAARARGLNMKASQTKTHIDAILSILGLDRHLKKKSSTLSGGYKRKLCMAISLVGYPRAVLLDEVSTGQDPASRNRLKHLIAPSLFENTSYDLPAILLSTHYMDEAQELATRAGIIVDGEFVTTGTIPRLQDKHCTDIFLEVVFKKEASPDCQASLIDHLESKGLSPSISEEFVGRVKIQLPLHKNTKSGSLANLFATIEAIKFKMEIQFYSLSTMSLEQIFIELSKKQFEVDGMK